jgi:acetyl esterase/lipase
MLLTLFFSLAILQAQEDNTVKPVEYIYASRDSIDLRAMVFTPQVTRSKPFNAIILFYGGGWISGNASWSFPPAEHFLAMGLVSICIDYRNCDEKKITPLDAMEDARDAVRWVRANAQKLNINPDKIIAYGWSAGAFLATSAAIFNATDSSSSFSCSPNALLLESPAISLLSDRWLRKILLDKAHIRDISPDEHIRPGLPPTILLQGELDTVTPLAGAERFHRRMLDNGNRCELEVYKDYGHLFTPADLPDNGWPQRDSNIQAKAFKAEAEFLKSLGFIN